MRVHSRAELILLVTVIVIGQMFVGWAIAQLSL